MFDCLLFLLSGSDGSKGASNNSNPEFRISSCRLVRSKINIQNSVSWFLPVCFIKETAFVYCFYASPPTAAEAQYRTALQWRMAVNFKFTFDKKQGIGRNLILWCFRSCYQFCKKHRCGIGGLRG